MAAKLAAATIPEAHCLLRASPMKSKLPSPPSNVDNMLPGLLEQIRQKSDAGDAPGGSRQARQTGRVLAQLRLLRSLVAAGLRRFSAHRLPLQAAAARSASTGFRYSMPSPWRWRGRGPVSGVPPPVRPLRPEGAHSPDTSRRLVRTAGVVGVLRQFRVRHGRRAIVGPWHGGA
uniref:Uncharacterized protein n=1 Tax=mine drainage metagenome TaxID=410659 RepID=E6PP14_9ZZZZ